MKRKKKSSGPVTSKHATSQGLKPKHLIYIAGAMCAIAAVCVGGVIYVRDTNSRQADIELVEAQSGVTSAVSTYIDDTLASDVENVRVFDASNKVLFTLNYSEGVPSAEYLPDVLLDKLRSKILGSIPESKIDLDAWSNGHTVIGRLMGAKSLEELHRGSLGWYAVDSYCSRESVTLDNNAKLIVGAYLDSAYTSRELLSFIACTGKYGSYDGVAKASAQLFNKEPSELSDNQINYLVYAYGEANPSYSDFISSNSEDSDIDEADFGFQNVDGDIYWLIRDTVASELQQIIGDTYSGESLNVSISIDTELQTLLQNEIDTGLRSSISLDSEGYTAVNGSVGVVDPNNGFIVALVGGRSVGASNRELVVNSPSLVGNYKAAQDAMDADSTLTYATLKEVELADGTTDYAQFGALVAYDQLGSIGLSPIVEGTTKLGELMEFGSSLYVDTSPRLIKEIQSDEGKAIYTANAANDLSADISNANVRALLMNSTDATGAIYSASSESGFSYGAFTSEYVLCMLFGTATTGYQLTFEDSDACITTAFKIEQLIADYYPEVAETIDPTGEVAKKVEASQQANSEIASKIVNEWVTTLKEMPITSVGTSSQFEQTYASYVTAFQTYAGIIPTDVYIELSGEIDAVRAARTEELLEFAA